jgi:hypothetical protein
MVAARVMTATLEPLEDASVVVLGMAVARICRATNLSRKYLNLISSRTIIRAEADALSAGDARARSSIPTSMDNVGAVRDGALTKHPLLISIR